MITLETAKKLREAGLRWEPKDDDVIANTETGITWTLNESGAKILKAFGMEEGVVWLLRLDQLLGEIEARGYSWAMKRIIATVNFRICKHPDMGYCFEANKDTPDEAAGLALKWALETERRDG